MSIDKLKSKFSNGTFVRDVKHFFEKINEIIDYLNGTSGEGSYKVYTALLTQTGTDAPIATVLKNTLGNITYLYNSDGYYSIISDNLFTDKTFIIIANTTDIGDYTGLNTCNVRKIDNSTFDIKTVSSSNMVMNECLLNSPIEIRVYN